MAVLSFSQSSAPGVYITESRAGTLPAEIASFNRIYMMGSASSTTVAALTPLQIVSREDFDNQFGSSAAVNLNAIDFFFRNLPRGIFYYIKVPIAFVSAVTLVTNGDGTYSLTINGTVISFVASGNTAQEIIDGLIAAINNDVTINTAIEAEPERDNAGSATYTNLTFFVRARDPLASVAFTIVAASPLSDMTAGAPAQPAIPNYWDFIYTIENSFDETRDEAGFLTCPEAFIDLPKHGDRIAIGNAMEAHARGEFYQWMAYIDNGPPVSVINTATDIEADRVGYTSQRGHSAFFAPWLVDTDNDYVSPAVAAAMVGIKRYINEGFQVPPAGTKVPLLGIAGPALTFSQAQLSTLNEDQVNVIREFRNRGTFVYGARTLSVLADYRFINTRIILNTYIRTLRETLETSDLIFEVVDGAGILFGRIKALADAVCYRFLQGNAFFGSEPANAYLNVCDETNNDGFSLEEGAVRLDSYVAPSPTAERIFAGVIRVPINQVPQE